MSVNSLVNDPDFAKLSPAEQKAVLGSVDPDFNGIADSEVGAVISGIRGSANQSIPKPLPLAQATTPQSVLSQSAPSNLLKLAGVATGNAPGIASAVLNSIPGMGDPSSIVPAVKNIAANPGQGLKAIQRMSAVQNNAPLTPQEQVPGTAGQIAGNAMEMIIPGEQGTVVNNALTNTARRAGMQVLGFTKRFLKNEKMVGNAEQTAQAMLDSGVIKPLSSATGLAERVNDVSDSSGKRIGEILKQLDAGQPASPGPSNAVALPQAKPVRSGRFFDPNQAVADLNELRPVDDNGNVLRGGAYDQINSQIDNAIATIRAHGNNPITLTSANQIKGLLQQGVNFENGKGVPNMLDKMIAGRFRQSVDSQLTNAAQRIGDPKLAQEFLEQKALYSHAQNAKDPIFNRISSELGNKGVGLTDWIAAAPELAVGDPMTALATLGVKRAAERFGPSLLATGANALAKEPVAAAAAAAPINATLGPAIARRRKQ